MKHLEIVAPSPEKAFKKSIANAKYFRNGRWLKKWWSHEAEAQAVLDVGIAVMKANLSGVKNLYIEAYIKIEKLGRAGAYVDKPSPENISGYLTQTEQHRRIHDLRATFR